MILVEVLVKGVVEVTLILMEVLVKGVVVVPIM